MYNFSIEFDFDLSKELSKSEFRQLLGFFVKSLRIASDLNISQMAKLLGVSPPQIHKYESGKDNIGLHTIYKICRVLNLDVISCITNFFAGLKYKSVIDNTSDFVGLDNESHRIVLLLNKLPSGKTSAILNLISSVVENETPQV